MSHELRVYELWSTLLCVKGTGMDGDYLELSVASAGLALDERGWSRSEPRAREGEAWFG